MRTDIYSRKNYRTWLRNILFLQLAALFIIVTETGKDRWIAILFIVPVDLLIVYQFSKTVMVSYDETDLYISNVKGETAIPFDKVITIKNKGYFQAQGSAGRFFSTLRLYYLDKEDKKRSAIFYIRRDTDKKDAWKGLQARFRLKFPATRVDDL